MVFVRLIDNRETDNREIEHNINEMGKYNELELKLTL